MTRLLIIGASGRAAAAAAARRQGFRPFVIDLFADADTRMLADVMQCPFDEYPAGFINLAQHAPPGPWMYTGGLENYPDVVEAISAGRELIGNPPEVLRAVRVPARLAVALGPIRYPRVVLPGDTPPAGTWVRKPVRGAGGLGVRFAGDTPPGEGEYFQEYIPGDPMSATFRDREMIGVSRQLVGESWLHAVPFAYAGSVGPVQLATDLAGRVEAVGHLLADAFGLRGVWGYDFAFRDGVPVVFEVNPRYPASAEVYDYATAGNVVGKAIYYSPRRLTFPPAGPWDDPPPDAFRRPDYADVPAAGSVIERGHPVLTLFAAGGTAEDCIVELHRRAADLENIFFPVVE